jgi:hypothetical protein
MTVLCCVHWENTKGIQKVREFLSTKDTQKNMLSFLDAVP